MEINGKRALVVGGGLAGMVAAAYLARFGFGTTVLEQSGQTGGNMSGFRRGPWYFDGGDQSFESLGVVFPILEDLGVYDRLRWSKARFRFVSDDFDFFLDSFDSAEDALRAAFPREDGIRELFAGIREVSAFLRRHCGPRSFPLLDDFSLGRLAALLPDLPRLSRWLTYDYRVKACSVIRDPALRLWFSRIGYYRMPYLFFAGFWDLWVRDYWHPEGGMQRIFDELEEKLRSLGGEVRTRCPVSRIESKGGRAVGAALASGEFVPADVVVYAGDYKALVSGLLEEGVFPARRAAKLRETRLTESLVAAYLGVDLSPAELGTALGAHHVFRFPNYDTTFPDAASDAEVHRRMWVAVNSFTGENPGFAPEGKSALTLQTYSSAAWMDHWGLGSIEGKRNDAYRALKEKVGRDLISTAESFIPGLSGKIEYLEVGSPISSYRFSRNAEGSSGGWCYDDSVSPLWKAPLKNLLRTPLSNLYAAGHYALWPGGVISAALSGRLAANLAAGRPILSPLGR